MDQVKILVQSGQTEKAKMLCAGENTPVANMIAKGVDRIGSPLKNIEVSIENVGKIEIYKLEKKSWTSGYRIRRSANDRFSWNRHRNDSGVYCHCPRGGDGFTKIALHGYL